MAAFEESYAFTRSLVGQKLEVAVAVDGSKVSMKALELAISFVQKKRYDTLALIHVIDNDAPVLESPEHIKNECELMTSAAGMDPEYIEFWTEHKGEAGVISAIAKAAEKVRADLLLVGAYGLKIEQEDLPKDSFTVHSDSFSVMGSTSDGSLRRTEVSVGIVKSTSQPLSGARKFMLATDDSPSAKVAFALLVTKLAKKEDKIYIFANIPPTPTSHLEEGDTVLAKYKVECDKLGLECELHAKHDASTNVSEDILAFAAEHDVDVLLLGTNGFTRNVLGSVSDRCASSARCTTIVVKDPRASLSKIQE